MNANINPPGLSRRHFMASAGAAATTVMAPSAFAATPIQMTSFNHVAILVSDIPRSVAFYQKLFGMAVQAHGRDGTVCLRLGDGQQFLAVMKAPPGVKPKIRHIGFAVADFDPAKMLKTLKDGGADARIDMRTEKDGGGGKGAPNGTPELSFNDPANFPMQLTHASYKGGAGMYGEIGVNEPAPGPAAIPVMSYNHCTSFADNADACFAFYQKHFNMPWLVSPAISVINAPVLSIGPVSARNVQMGICYISRPGAMPPGQAEINHFCFGTPNFDHEKLLKILDGLGLKQGSGPMTVRFTKLKGNGSKGANGPVGGPALGGPPDGTPEIFVADPDGISVQIQDLTFCGEANAKNGVCPGT